MNTMGWQCSSAPADEELSILVYHNHLTSSAHVSSLNSNIQTRSNNIFYQNDKHPTTLLYKSQPSSNTLAKTHARTLLRVHQYLYCAPADGSYFISLFFRRAERVRTSPSCSHTHYGPKIRDITHEEEPHPSISGQVCQERVSLFPL